MLEDQNEIQQYTDYVDNFGRIIDSTGRAVIQLKIQYPAITIIEIARKLKINRDKVRRRLDQPEVIECLRELQKSALKILLESQTKAALRLRKEIDNIDAHHAIAACKEILKGVLSDNVNLNVNTKSQIRHFLESLSDEDIDELSEDSDK